MSDFTQDPRLTLIGAGFAGDREVEDGVHLRWSFDPDLGFPPAGFRLFVREPVRKTTWKASFGVPIPAVLPTGSAASPADSP